MPITYITMSVYLANHLVQHAQAKQLVYHAKILTTLPDLPVSFVFLLVLLVPAPPFACHAL